MATNKKENEILLDTAQDVIILGKSYKMRRLSTRDVFTFGKIISKALKEVGNVTVTSEEALGLVLMSGIAQNDKEIAEFYSSLIGLTPEEFLAQPPEFFDAFLEVLPQQYDLQSFFATVLKTIKSLGSLWQK